MLPYLAKKIILEIICEIDFYASLCIKWENITKSRMGTKKVLKAQPVSQPVRTGLEEARAVPMD